MKSDTLRAAAHSLPFAAGADVANAARRIVRSQTIATAAAAQQSGHQTWASAHCPFGQVSADVGVGGNFFHVPFPSRWGDIRLVVALQEHVPLFPRDAANLRLLVALLVQRDEHLAAAADIDARVRRVANQGQNLAVTGLHPLHVAPVAAFGHDRQLKLFCLQMQVQLPDAGKAFEVLEHFFDRALDARVGMLLTEFGVTTDVAWRQAVVLFAPLSFVSQALLHPLDDQGQFELVERALDAQQHAVLGVRRVVQSALVGQQDVLKTTDAYHLRPVLIVADQARQFAGGDESGLAGDNGLQEHLKIGAPVLRTAGLAGVPVKQDDLWARPAKRGDMLDHALLPLVSFSIPPDLTGTALTQIDVSGPFQMVWFHKRMIHCFWAPSWVRREFQDRSPSAPRGRTNGSNRMLRATRTTAPPGTAGGAASDPGASPGKTQKFLLESCREGTHWTRSQADAYSAREQVRAGISARWRTPKECSCEHYVPFRTGMRERPAGCGNRHGQPVLLVVNQRRPFARGDESHLAGDQDLQKAREVGASRQRTAGLPRAAVEQEDLRTASAARGDMLDQGWLPLSSFPVLANLAGTARWPTDASGALRMVGSTDRRNHRSRAASWGSRQFRDRGPSAP